MKRLDYLPEARRDLADIFDFIARDNREAAKRMVNRVYEAATRLETYPESGRERPEVGEGARSLLVGRYLIFYRVKPNSIEVARVVHGSRDIIGLLIEGITPDNLHGEIDSGPPVGKEFW